MSSEMTNRARWSFVGKVYTILLLQLLATIAIGATVKQVPSISHFLLKTHAGLAVSIVIIITPFIVLIPMICLRHLKPVNYYLVAIFTVSLALQVGIICVVTPGMVILESVFLTTVAFLTLTLYTFWATWRGYDFSLLGPFLSEALLLLIIFGLIQIFHPRDKTSVMLLGAFGSLVFCIYIVFDTQQLIERHSEDNDYILAAVELYLDILNLFNYITELLEGGESDDDGSCVCCSAKCCECLGECCGCLGECCFGCLAGFDG